MEIISEIIQFAISFAFGYAIATQRSHGHIDKAAGEAIKRREEMLKGYKKAEQTAKAAQADSSEVQA